MRHWFTMKVVEDDEDEEDEDKKKNPFAEIMIYDAIGASFLGEQTVSAGAFITALADLGDVPEIKLRINSPGGDVFDGVAIYNAIKNHRAKVTAHVDGLAASAASFVAMAADHIVMPSNAFMLVHNASGLAMGQADDMRAMAADLDRIDKSMLATYVARTRQPTAKLRALMKEDRLMDAKEAKELGFTDEVTAPVKLSANFSLRLLPKAAAERFRLETGNGKGDPPLLDVPEGQEEQPTVPPAPPPQPRKEPGSEERRLPPDPFMDPAHQPHRPAGQVIDLPALRQQAIDEHRAYVAEVTDLCTLARAPERVGGYVRRSVPVAQVRKELLGLSAGDSVLPQHPMAPRQTPAMAWTAITDKLNARHK